LKGQNLMFVGIDEQSKVVQERSGKRITRTKTFVSTFVAFFVGSNGEWRHYCNHQVAHGGTVTVGRDGSDGDHDASTTAGEDTVKSGVAHGEALKHFLEAALKHFGTRPDEVLITRCSVPDSLVQHVNNEEKYLAEEALGNIPFLFAIAQPNTDVFFSVSEEQARTVGAQGIQQSVNVPRGFWTQDFVEAIRIDGEERRLLQGLYMNSGNCNLSLQKPVRYLFLNSLDGVTLLRSPETIAQILFETSFLFPNKPDSLKVPIWLQCADKYCSQIMQFVNLNEVNGTLSADSILRVGMHYL